MEGHEREILEVNRSIESLHKDTVKLSGLITLKRGEQEGLQQSNMLVESDFVNTLKVRGWIGVGKGRGGGESGGGGSGREGGEVEGRDRRSTYGCLHEEYYNDNSLEWIKVR